MAHLIGHIPIIGRLVDGEVTEFNVPAVKTVDVDSLTDPLGRTLRHLTRADHSNYAPLSGKMFEKTNTLSPLLVAMYWLGGDAEALKGLYEEVHSELGEWIGVDKEVMDSDWQEYYGDGTMLKTWVDLFEDAVVNKCGTHSWEAVMSEYLFKGPRPLIEGAISTNALPVIYLADAHEIQSKEMMASALSLIAAQYSQLTGYIKTSGEITPSFTSSSAREILTKIHKDERFSSITRSTSADWTSLFTSHEFEIIDYVSSWIFPEPSSQFKEAYQTVLGLFLASENNGRYSRGIGEVLAAGYAVRRLLHFLPADKHIGLVRGWWMLVIGNYIWEGRLVIESTIAMDRKGHDWGYVDNVAIETERRRDILFVQCVRAMRDLTETWGDVEEKVLSSAVHFVERFKSWAT